MIRFIFAPGICQIINVAAALAQERAAHSGDRPLEDVLVLYSTCPGTERGRTMEQAARTLWAWKDIVWAHDVLVAHLPTRRLAPIVKDVLWERLGPAPDEVWVSKPATGPAKLVLHAYPDSRVVLCEDGAEEHIPWPVLCGPSHLRALAFRKWPSGLVREASHWRGRPECLDLDGICAKDRKRVVVRYSFLDRFLDAPETLAGVPVRTVGMEALKGRLDEVRVLGAEGECLQPDTPTGAPAVLFLPQAFATLFLTSEDEYALYEAAVAQLVEKGYTVLWKEHPCETTPLAPTLREKFGAERLIMLRVRQHLPVECLVGGWDLAAVVSVSSTSLLYLNGLYGFPAYTAAGLLAQDRWLKWTDLELARLFIRQLPGLDKLPPAGTNIQE